VSTALTTDSPDLVGRWIRYIKVDDNTGREQVAVTLVTGVDIIYARPPEHKNLDSANRVFVEWLLNQDGEGKVSRVDIMALSPEQVVNEEEPYPIVTIDYNALGKPMKIVEFSPATVQEVLTYVNKVAAKNEDKIPLLLRAYRMVQEGNVLTFPLRNG
jgi:hypothetical protein